MGVPQQLFLVLFVGTAMLCVGMQRWYLLPLGGVIYALALVAHRRDPQAFEVWQTNQSHRRMEP
jgi:type IV secretory pathway TrbD component